MTPPTTPTRAVLVFDSAQQCAPEGVRALPADGRQMVFRHLGFQVELMLQASWPRPMVWGKVFQVETGLPCSGARVKLLEPTGTGSRDTQSDTWGEFGLAAVGGRDSMLLLRLADAEFVCCLGSREPVSEEVCVR